MSRTFILGYKDEATAQTTANNFADDYTVKIIGPTDQARIARDDELVATWISGAAADLYIVIATKDVIADPGPRPAAGD